MMPLKRKPVVFLNVVLGPAASAPLGTWNANVGPLPQTYQIRNVRGSTKNRFLNKPFCDFDAGQHFRTRLAKKNPASLNSKSLLFLLAHPSQHLFLAKGSIVSIA